MAKVNFEIVQKPIEERIIDAACIYWEVDRSYFTRDGEKKSATKDSACTTVTYRKSVIYYLIKSNTTYSFKFIADKFGFLSHQPVMRLIENLDSTKEIFKQHFNDINQIQHLADKLDASFIQTEIKLVNNHLEIKKA